MTNISNTLQELPPADIVTQALTLAHLSVLPKATQRNHEEHHRRLLEILDKYPSLAWTDERGYAKYPGTPLAGLTAAHHQTHDIFYKCLQLGSSPMAKCDDGTPALLKFLKENGGNGVDDALELALKHPACATLDAKDKDGNIALSFTDRLMAIEGPKSRRLFTEMLKRTPSHLLREKMSLMQFFGSDETAIPYDNLIFVARLLADHGVNLDKRRGNYHPMYMLNEAERDDKGFRKNISIAGQLLACGLDESALCGEDGDDWKMYSLGALLRGKARTDICPEQTGLAIRRAAHEILNAELDRIIAGGENPRDVLLTPAQHATWQAQGLAMQGMLMPLFDKEHAARFGGEKAQIAFACEVAQALPPRHRRHVNTEQLLREEHLARPSSSAVVEYLRGGAADVAQRGGAA